MNTAAYTDDYLQAAQKAANYRARKLASRFGMSREEREDLTQELLTDLLAQAPHYNPAISSASTFTGVVSKNRATELLDRYIKDKTRLLFVSTVAANDEDEGQNDVLGAAGVVPFWSVDEDLLGLTHALHDLEKAVRNMRADQVDLLELLVAHPSMADACRAYDGSTPTFYRRVSELKMHLRVFGIKVRA